MLRHFLAALAASAFMLAALLPQPLARADDFIIFAAISLKPALEKAKPELEKTAGAPIQFNFGASGTLSAQIIRGAYLNLFISADALYVDKLQKAGVTFPGSEKILALNDLVLITPASGSPVKKFADLGNRDLKKLAIGEPRIVPAGRYAQQTLTHLKLYDTLKDANRLVMAENVTQVLAYVERGEVDAGVVYRTDALNSRKVILADIADDDWHEPIVYKMAIIKGSPRVAERIQERLLAADMRELFVGFGFKPAPTKKVQP